MADLENLLLEAAGRTSGGRSQQPAPSSRRQVRGSYFDEGSESKDEDDSKDEQTYGGRRAPSSAQVPLKKRAEVSDGEDEGTSVEEGDGEGDEDSSGDESDVGSDLFKDEYDKEALFKMCELERELILEERGAKVSDRKLQEMVRTNHSSGRKTHTRREMTTTPPVPPSHGGARSSVRSAERAAAMDEALNELRARRMKQQDAEGRGLSPENRKCSSGSSSSRMESESRSEGEEEGSPEESGSGESEGGEEEDDEERGEGAEGGSEAAATFDQVKAVTIQRTKLAKWFTEPFFERLIAGCFVRVGVGKSKEKALYKICMVRGVETVGEKAYKLESKTTSKYLDCSVPGRDKSELWQMAMVSDKEPLEEEYERWSREAEGCGIPIPGRKEMAEKAEAIMKCISSNNGGSKYSPESAKKSRAEWVRPMNVAAEKERLRREMGAAESRGEAGEVERIKGRLRELEACRKVENIDSKAVRLAEMNKRNRAENYKTASGLKPAGLRSGEEGYDPFSRRWTRSMNYYMSKTEEAAAAVEEEVRPAVVETEGAEATAAALEAAAGAGKLVDTSAPVDQGTESYTLHDFPLHISLAALQRLGGPQGGPAGFMARKQRQEAVMGCKVPLNDRRRHPSTLTVSDYKRRRGLL